MLCQYTRSMVATVRAAVQCHAHSGVRVLRCVRCHCASISPASCIRRMWAKSKLSNAFDAAVVPRLTIGWLCARGRLQACARTLDFQTRTVPRTSGVWANAPNCLPTVVCVYPVVSPAPTPNMHVRHACAAHVRIADGCPWAYCHVLVQNLLSQLHG